MYFLKPVEQGLDVKFTAGIHRGCLRVQAAANGNIRTIQDLRGKRIGVPGMGTPPFIFANRVLGANGIDPGKEISWLVFPAGELGLALEKGEVDAVADSEPIGSMLLAGGKVKNVADQATDAPYKDEYCCAVLVNGKFLKANPKAAAAATRALLKAAKWVETNPAAAARMSVEKKYLASNPELNTVAISHLRYVPSVSGAEAAVKSAAAEMKRRYKHAQPEHRCGRPGQTRVRSPRRRFGRMAPVPPGRKGRRLGQVPPDEDIRLRVEPGWTATKPGAECPAAIWRDQVIAPSPEVKGRVQLPAQPLLRSACRSCGGEPSSPFPWQPC